jgi:hypothetical protein
MKLTIYLSLFLFAVLNCGTLSAQYTGDKIIFDNQTYNENIRTVEMYRSGWRLSPPIRNLRDTASLILEFDDLSEETPHYTYTLIHCTSGWEQSDIVNSEYLSGLAENEILNYRFSRNTLKPFTHYKLAIPNSNVQVRLPGNYILYVYKDFNQDEPVLTRRFYIIDPLVHIIPDVHRTDDVKYLSTAQEVDFTINYQALQPDDPRRNFKVTVCQNLNYQTAITNLLPKYIQPGELVYNYEEENLFQGGSEFLHFDTKNLKYNSDRVQEIRFERPIKHIYLMPDRPKAYSSYEYQEDLNGNFLVKWDDAFDSDLEADYVMVHFALNTKDSIEGSDVFLFGELTGWKTEDRNKCRYNGETGQYEINLLMKQGYYNYSYATRKRSNNKIDLTNIDGNHYETENDYYIFVYYRDIRERFDRLVGVSVANSVKLPKAGY